MAEEDLREIEGFAREENNWVRARILKKEHANHPEQPGDLAERAARMANDSLGERHPAHGVALLNLGIFHEFVQSDTTSAEEFFRRGREILGQDHPEVGEAFFKLAVFLLQEKHDPARADRLFQRALEVRRHTADADPLALADCLIGLASAKVQNDDLAAARPLMGEAAAIQTRCLPEGDERLLYTLGRLQALKAIE
jgi:hypothetical protein